MTNPKRITNLDPKLATEISTDFKIVVDKYSEAQALSQQIIETNNTFSFLLLKDIPPKQEFWTLNFPYVLAEIEILHDFHVKINSYTSPDTQALQYSKDNGITWNNIFPVDITGLFSRWRVLNFGLKTFGAVKLNAIKL
jgi:hypothetical protein